MLSALKSSYRDAGAFRIILPLVFGLCVAGIFAHLLMADAAATLQNAELTQDQLKQALEERSKLALQLPVLKIKLRRMEKGLQPVSASYMPIEDVLRETTRLAKNNKLRLLSFLPGKKSRIVNSELNRLPLRFEVRGSYAAVQGFLRAYKGGFYNVYLSDIHLKRLPGGLQTEVQAVIDSLLIHRQPPALLSSKNL